MRASARRESQQRRMRERTHGGGRALSAAFLEPDRGHESDEGDVSLSAIKNRYKSGAKDLAMRGGRRPFSDDDEDEDEDEGSDLDSRSGHRKGSMGSSSKPSSSTKRIIDSDDDDTSRSPSGHRNLGDRLSSDRSEAKRRAAHVIEESDDD